MRRLPPLNALRTFEASARLLSFTKAAEELNVTPAAVSYQVNNLEKILGVRVFERNPNGLKLSNAGKKALPLLSAGFDKIADSVKALTKDDTDDILTLSVAPGFAMKWLIKRLPSFESAYPRLQVRIDPTPKLIKFDKLGADIAIRLGHGEYSGLVSTRLTSEQYVPVCAPSLMTGTKALKTTDDINKHPLIHVDWEDSELSRPNWDQWFSKAGVQMASTKKELFFSAELLAIEAAINGQGVALISKTLVGGDIQTGALISPFDITLEPEFGFFASYPENTAHLSKTAGFLDWIKTEAANTAFPFK